MTYRLIVLVVVFVVARSQRLPHNAPLSSTKIIHPSNDPSTISINPNYYSYFTDASHTSPVLQPNIYFHPRHKRSPAAREISYACEQNAGLESTRPRYGTVFPRAKSASDLVSVQHRRSTYNRCPQEASEHHCDQGPISSEKFSMQRRRKHKDSGRERVRPRGKRHHRETCTLHDEHNRPTLHHHRDRSKTHSCPDEPSFYDHHRPSNRYPVPKTSFGSRLQPRSLYDRKQIFTDLKKSY